MKLKPKSKDQLTRNPHNKTEKQNITKKQKQWNTVQNGFLVPQTTVQMFEHKNKKQRSTKKKK